jgi:hypothetical protein
VRDSGGVEQRRDPRPGRSPDLAAPLPYDEPVSVAKRGHVGNRSEGDQIEGLPQ